MNLIKTFVLWNKIGKDIKHKQRTLRLISNSENEEIPDNFDIDKHLEDLRSLRKVYQDNAIVYDNAGYKKIADRLLILKEIMIKIERIVQTWRQKNGNV